MASKHRIASRAILGLYREGKISADEGMLLIAVDWSSLHTPERLSNTLGMSPYQVRQMIQEMEDAKLLMRKGDQLFTPWNPTGVGGFGLIEVDVNSIISRVSRARAPSLPPLKGERLGGRGRNEVKVSSQSLPIWIELSTSLADAISSVRKVNHSSKIKGWAESFRKLHEVDKVPIPKIQSVLQWYCQKIQEGDLIRENCHFTPVAYSGSAFREKWLRIEDAMLRDKGGIPTTPLPPSQDPYHRTKEEEEASLQEQDQYVAQIERELYGEEE